MSQEYWVHLSDDTYAYKVPMVPESIYQLNHDDYGEIFTRGDTNGDTIVNSADASLVEEYLNDPINHPLTDDQKLRAGAAWDDYNTLDVYDKEAILFKAVNEKFLGYNPSFCVTDIEVEIIGPRMVEAGQPFSLTALLDPKFYGDTWQFHWENDLEQNISSENPLILQLNELGKYNLSGVFDSNETICEYSVSAYVNAVEKINYAFLPFVRR